MFFASLKIPYAVSFVKVFAVVISFWCSLMNFLDFSASSFLVFLPSLGANVKPKTEPIAPPIIAPTTSLSTLWPMCSFLSSSCWLSSWLLGIRRFFSWQLAMWCFALQNELIVLELAFGRSACSWQCDDCYFA